MGVTESEVLDATKRCCERWGFAKVTVDDIALEAGTSRATLYRMFPGGKEVLFEAMRVRQLEDFFSRLRGHLEGVDDFEDLLVSCVVHSLAELRADQHLAAMLAVEPGDALHELTVDGLPHIIRVASAYLVPLITPHLDRTEATWLVDVLARLVISYFLAPSEQVDLVDPESARAFIHRFVLPAFTPALTTPLTRS